MRSLTEHRLRQLAGEQECQAEIRAAQMGAGPHAFPHHWSPVVAVGLLALGILTAVTWIVTLLSAIR